jgi:uncharacterized protein DUF4350
MTRGWRIGIGIVVVLVAFGLVLHVLGTLTGGTPGGPQSSSYSTGRTGAGAYAELLGKEGHPVDRVRRAPHAAQLDPSHTVALLDPPSVARVDAQALRRFVTAGGRLVAGGPNIDWLAHVVARFPSGDVQGTRIFGDVVSAGVRSWTDAGGGLVLARNGDRILVVSMRVGRGSVLALADASPLQNRLLGERGNAALGLDLAGARGRPVDFLETYHGYGRSSGIAALPLAWKLLLTGLALSSLVLMVARGRRFGPPESRERELAPPRQLYVDSVGTILARTRRRDEAVAPVRRRARELVLRRAALPPDADDDALRTAARRLGIPETEVEALLRPARNDGDVLTIGRALARIGQDLPR